MLAIKILVGVVAAIGGATVVCPLCEVVAGTAAESTTVATQPSDTATVHMHISGMTCGTCPVTARLALKKLTGVYEAKVTLDDSLGVVRYDPRRLSPGRIAAHLTELTGYKARVLTDSGKPVRSLGTADRTDHRRKT